MSSRTDCFINRVGYASIDGSTRYYGIKEQGPLILSACSGEVGGKQRSFFKEEMIVVRKSRESSQRTRAKCEKAGRQRD